MIDKSFLEKVEEMAAPKFEQEHGIKFSSKKMFKVDKPLAAHLTAHTLDALVEYCREVDPASHVIHIVGPESVVLMTILDAVFRTRETLLVAECISESFKFGNRYNVEEFIISMQAQFVQCGNVAAILAVVGNITATAEHKTLDDGVSQTVTARVGIAKIENAVVPNPVILSPYRTFIEIEQPASKFVFRMKANPGDTPTCSLHEADGGAWKNEAIANIRAYLLGRLPEGFLILA